MNRYAWSLRTLMAIGKGEGKATAKSWNEKWQIEMPNYYRAASSHRMGWIRSNEHFIFFFLHAAMIAISACEWYKSICTIKYHSKMLLSVHVYKQRYTNTHGERKRLMYVRKLANNNSPRNNGDREKNVIWKNGFLMCC